MYKRQAEDDDEILSSTESDTSERTTTAQFANDTVLTDSVSLNTGMSSLSQAAPTKLYWLSGVAVGRWTCDQ